MRGLRHADRLIADSQYTKSTLVDNLKIQADSVDVVYPGIDSRTFRPHTVPDSFRQRHQLPADRLYILYVGSEDPRKNFPMLLQSMQLILREIPDVLLLKVGGGVNHRTAQ